MTPLLYFLLDTIGFIIIMIYPLQLLNFKNNKRIYAVYYVLSFVSLIVASFLFRCIEALQLNPMKSLIQISVFVTAILICFSDKFMQRLITVFIILFSNLIGESVGASVYFFDLPLSGSMISILCTTISILALLIILIISKQIYFRVFKTRAFTSKPYMFDIVLCSQILCFISPVYTLGFIVTENSDRISYIFPYIILLVITMIVCAIAEVFLFRILITNAENHDLKEEVQLLKIKAEYELEYYNKVKANSTETRKLYHDINNLLMVLKSDDLSVQRKNYIVEELSESLKRNKVRVFCENELVNVILNNKLELMEDSNIEFSANLNIPESISIKDIDLCRIVTNVVDNAIDSCKATEGIEKTVIVLTSVIKDDYFIFKCSNTSNGDIQKKGNRLMSTKPQHKGLGIEILKDIANDYSGDISTALSGNIFETSIMLKLS